MEQTVAVKRPRERGGAPAGAEILRMTIAVTQPKRALGLPQEKKPLNRPELCHGSQTDERFR